MGDGSVVLWIVPLMLILALSSCGPAVNCVNVPIGGTACFAKDKHIPFFETPMRVGVYQPDPSKREAIVHWDTAQPSTTLEQLGPMGSTIQSAGSARSALGF